METLNRVDDPLTLLSQLASSLNLENVNMRTNSKTGTATVTGSRDGMQFTTTIQRNSYGVTQSTSRYVTNMGRDALIQQARELRRQGYKQTEIADMLGISQASVSKYLRM